jgi:hypothetical protein
MFRIPIIVILIYCVISSGYAQDSLKKKAPVKPSAAKTYPKTYKYHSYRYRTKADSIAKAKVTLTPPATALAPAKTDTAAAAPTVVVDKSLNSQYQYLLGKVYHYQQPLIAALWKSASDTLNSNRRKLRDAQSKLANQNKTIDSLTAEVTNKDKAIVQTDGVDVLGIALTKTTYNLIVWGLVAIFGLTALVVILRSGSFKREARYRVQLYNELEEEFKTYKTKANDKEKKLARELQTERNKLDDLLGK